MRNLTSEECSIISGAGDRSGTLTVSAETVGAAIGGGIGSIGGVAGGVVGTIVGGAVGNYVTGDRAPGSIGPSGIPWGGSNGGGTMWGNNNNTDSN
ncbi:MULTISPECIES: hypothetical protein [Serratia]|uniref:Colicin V synthesis protein n=1 Tax=Serratia nematodiphila TaxID=458197 RepID=A0A1G5LBP5_9GAMM|nr:MULTISPECIES: hypothetical protein [Serratia]ANM79212.1 hypothetical protein A4U88_3896 [Serratia marcescens]AQT55408.1 hypothetical protein AR325_26565 [Serratia marcescens]MCF1610647.1 hypothetical protein [Serratia marcescens]MDP8823840.1 hypothetical protein [Serratia marcescens]MDT0208681.1 hypothetical protein [Serratia marcescens]